MSVGGAEQEIVDDSGSVERKRTKLMGQGEDDVEVLDGKQVSASRLEPVGLSQCLTLRAVTIATGVVDGAAVPAAVTGFEMTAERCGAALADGSDHFVSDGAHRVRSGIALAMTA